MIRGQEDRAPARQPSESEALADVPSRASRLLVISEDPDLAAALMPDVHTSTNAASSPWTTEQLAPAALPTLTSPTVQAPDLVLLHVTPDLEAARTLLDHAKIHWPYTGFLAFTGPDGPDLQPLTEHYGTMPLLRGPDLQALQMVIRAELASSSLGPLRGIALPSVLQMLEWECKSVAVFVKTPTHWGRLHLCRGHLVGAYVHQTRQHGDEAALEILGWPAPGLSLERSYQNGRRNVQRGMNALLMDALRLQDEQQRTSARDDPAPTEEGMISKRPQKRREDSPPPPDPAPPAPHTPAPSAAPSTATPPEVTDMANVKTTLDSILSDIEGTMAAALVDYSSGMMLGSAGSGVNLDVAAAGNTEVVKAKLRTMQALGIQGEIEDILITLQQQYHIIYLIPGQSLFLYLVLNKDRANLAMARYKLKAFAGELKL